MKRSSSYTMHDVARLARVSVTTVSTIVNGRGGVSPELTRRVEDAISTLDYHPNEVARSLKVNRTFTLGVVVPDVSNFFFNTILQVVETRARRHGYSVVLCDSHEDPAEERDLLRMLISRRADGILLASAQSELAESSLARRRPPIVCFDREPVGFKGMIVVIDNVKASYQATRYLIELGHRRIATIAGPETTLTGSGRLEGYRKAVQEAGISIREGYIRPGGFSMEGAYDAAVEILRLPDPPTAVFAANNRMNLGLMRALKDIGLACPQDVSVCGFDDFDWSDLFTPQLTMIVQPTLQIGEVATEMLLQAINASDQQHERSEGNRVVLQAELRVHESTAPPADCSAHRQSNSIPSNPNRRTSQNPLLSNSGN
ncbi:MAG TPA: LacI family DNA-binding transcriptional regulator [Terriglobia bacterium]|nr:LacI family DNA-binding transcriptional regulator [Terriglobia bacterium]